MSLLALTNQLTSTDVSLDALYLDPNNPRFAETDSIVIEDAKIDDADIQERTRRKMIDEHNVGKLKMNMEVNGYLPIDRIIVREFSQGKYVVLEGNRRICAAKMISNIAVDGSDVQQEVLDSLKQIPVLQYTGEDLNASWIFQGLRHITGIEDWSAFNKAKLLVEQMEEEELNLTEVGRRFGLTPFGAGQWVRGYYAFKQAKEESDFITEVEERSYPYFQELFSRSSSEVREWIEWDDTNRKFRNLINLNEFVSWLYPRTPDANDDSDTLGKGNWEHRRIARRDDIRDIAWLIREDQEMFQQFRKSGALEQAYAQSLTRKFEKEAREKSDPAKEAFESIRVCAKALENIPLRVIKNGDLKIELGHLLEILNQKIGDLKQVLQ